MGHRVQIVSGKHEVLLPDGGAYDSGDVVTLTDAQWNQIDHDLIGPVIIDLGADGGGGIIKKRLVLTIIDPIQMGGGQPNSGTISFGGLQMNEMGDDMVFFDSSLDHQAEQPWTYGQIMTAGLYSFDFSWVGQGLLGSNVTYGGVLFALVIPGDPVDPAITGETTFMTPNSHPNFSPSANMFRQSWCKAGSEPYPASAEGLWAVQYSFDADGDSPGGYMLLQGAQLTICRLA